MRDPQDAAKMLSPGTFDHGGALGTQGWIDLNRQMIFVLLVQRLGLENGDASELRRTFQEAAFRAAGQ